MPQRITKHGQSCGNPPIGANSVQFSPADLVNTSDTGFLRLVPDANTKIAGASVDSRTMASDNQTVAQVKPLFVTWRGLEILLGVGADLVQGDIGAFMDLDTFTTNAFRVTRTGATEESTTTLGTGSQVKCLQRDPERTSENNVGAFEPAVVASFAY